MILQCKVCEFDPETKKNIAFIVDELCIDKMIRCPRCGMGYVLKFYVEVFSPDEGLDIKKADWIKPL